MQTLYAHRRKMIGWESLIKNPKQSICTVNWSDVLGGAGIQADAATYAVLGEIATTVLTGFAAHNTMGKVVNQEVDLDLLKTQFEGLWVSIPPSIIKCGALFSIPTMSEVLHWLAHFTGQIVYDPVILSPAGEVLLDPGAIDYLKANFLPHISVLTANFSQLTHFSGSLIESDEEIEGGVRYLSGLGVRAILLKVGPSKDYYRSYWLCRSGGFWLKSPLHTSRCSYGAGSMLSAAVTAFLSKGMGMIESFAMAQIFVSGCIRRGRVHGHVGFAMAQPLVYHPNDALLVNDDSKIPPQKSFFAYGKPMGRYKKRFHAGLRAYDVLVWAYEDPGKDERIAAVRKVCQKSEVLFCLEGALDQAIRHEVDLVLVAFSMWQESFRDDLLRLKIHVGIKVSNQIELIRASSLKPSFLVIAHNAFHAGHGDLVITMVGLTWWAKTVSCPILVEDRLGSCHLLEDVLSQQPLVRV